MISLLLICGLSFTTPALGASDFEIEGTTLMKYTGTGGEVTVPNGIQKLAPSAFENSMVTKVNLPETLTEIGPHCFFSCGLLTDITIPASVKGLEDATQAFGYNRSLKAFRVAPGGHYVVKDGVLFTADGKTLLFYPVGKENTEYSIPEGTEILVNTSLSGASIEKLNIPSTMKDIGGDYVSIVGLPKLLEISVAAGNKLFRSVNGVLYTSDTLTLMCYPNNKPGKELRKEDFPAGLRRIAHNSFWGNRNLETIELPDGLEYLGGKVFLGAHSLKNVIIPASVKYIGYYTFADCMKLERVTILNPNVQPADYNVDDPKTYNIFWDANKNATLCGYANSKIQAYAETCGLNFEILNDPAKIKDFVSRCYRIILGREADQGGLDTWYNELASGRKTAAEIIDCFVRSTEFRNKKLSNAETVEILYKAMIDRAPDPAGKSYWVGQLESGKPLQAIINGFCGSEEFKYLCKVYGIKPGTVAVPEDQPAKPDAADGLIQSYVTRCYEIILGRKPDEGGMKTWVNELNSGRKAAAEIIDCFVRSTEFQNKKLSNADAVEILYKAMLGRGSDAAGKSSWVSQLESGKPLAAVINGFCGSAEFGNICKTYGINPGTVTVPDTQPGQPTGASDEKIKAFVSRCYRIILGRDADEGGMNTWFGELKSQRKAAAEIIELFVNSPEFQGKKLSNPDATEILYKAMLGRGSDAAGKSYWVAQLNNGQPLTAIINGFCGSAEFKSICDAYGIKPGSVKVQTLNKAEESLSGQAEQAAPAVKKTENQGVTKVEIVNASDTVNENLGTAVQAIYVNEEKAKEFIGRCYRCILGREASASELDSWISQMLNGSRTPDQIARGFLFSGEFQGRNIGNEELVKILYRVYLNREADAEGLAAWTQKLNEGTSLQELLNTFSRTSEFKAVVKNMAQ